MKLEKPYNKENLDKAIGNIKLILEKQDEIKSKYYEILTTLIRHRRAIEPECWVIEKEWEKLDNHIKQNIIREERCVKMPSSGSYYQDMKEFPYFAKRQWEKDRELLTKEGKIVA